VILVPNEAEIQLLTDLLSAGENWILELYQSNTTPAETDAWASNPHTVANFTGYTPTTLTRTRAAGTWQPVDASGVALEAANARSLYGTAPLSWTCGATGNSVYGYHYRGATSAKFIAVERFAAPRTLVTGDTLTFRPAFELA
jgi:hypothetical protein